MKILTSKGFTLLETLVSALLLGILMLILTAVSSTLGSISEHADQIVMQSGASTYILTEIQSDLAETVNILQTSKNMITLVKFDSSVSYQVSDNMLLRDSKVLGNIISGNITSTHDSVKFYLIMNDHSCIDAVFYKVGDSSL